MPGGIMHEGVTFLSFLALDGEELMVAEKDFHGHGMFLFTRMIFGKKTDGLTAFPA